MATLKDIAEHVGISITAASLALRDHHSISIATKKKVWAAQKALGYRLPLRPPESISREVAAAKSEVRNIAFLLIDREYEGTSYASGFQRIAESIAERMWRPVYLSGKLEEIVAGKLPPLLVNGDFSGIIVSGAFNADAYREIARLLIPIVVRGRYPLGDEPWSSCEPDFTQGAELVLSKATAQGHRRIALLEKDPNNNYGRYLRSALVIAAQGRDVELFPFTVKSDSPSTPQLRPADLLEKGITLILVGTASCCPVAYTICEEAGLRIPDDISLVSYGVRPNSALCPEPAHITAIPGINTGITEKLARLIENPATPHTRELYPQAFVASPSFGEAPGMRRQSVT